MAAYIQGNLAVEPKREPSRTVKVKETRKVVYRNKSLPTQEKLLYLFTVAVLVLVAGVILWRYAQIYQMNATILKMQQDIKRIEAENMALKQQIDKGLSPERLKELAESYGMVPSDESEQQTPAPSKSTASAQQPQGKGADAKTAGAKKTSAPAGGTKVAMSR
ncbi:cell division protein FtsL [Gordoniibacillus kamchatkensis]|uniref:cell division protein FtsL n=1 Tax=Gordoniibacillus kamchatkensis TaxID=1590651 RepID=UPI0009E1AC3B|nr:cell division protein FtsL [Paenibacillus sp. VKM B-2647]